MIASPPALHAAQAGEVLKAGFDVLIEKPAFVTTSEAEATIAAAQASGALLIEAFMHRHTALHARAMADWAAHRTAIDRIDIAFVVPALPEGTFRGGSEPGGSVLYDFGCYGLSLIVDFGLLLDALALREVAHPGTLRERLVIGGACDGVEVVIACGVGDAYANTLTLHARSGDRWHYEPFFYGRPGRRSVVTSAETEEIGEPDAFRTMFAVPREVWAASAAQRAASLLGVTAALERLQSGLQ
jgi:Oxidoreductase family, NAD-binding Rossmann fold